MTFYDLVDQATALLQQRGRLSYRALTRQFELDDAQLDDLKFELIEAEGVAADQDGTVLVWIGQAERKSSPSETRGNEPGPPATRTALAAPESVEAERRQLSVLFCDLAGSTALGAELDPEELREVLRDYQTVCAGLVERFGGVVARQVGDGLLMNFGYPRAHEDDAARAVRAGLSIVAAMPELNGRLARRFPALESYPLQVRIGLHTGLVVIGALGGSTYRDPMAVVGETPNIAARLQGLAAPDTVVMSGATHRLLGGAFVCEDLGRQALKGIAAPMPVHRVLREREAPESLAASTTGRVIPLVGREEEIGVLVDRWEQSQEGLGQFVLLSGEAGIGKSRLVRELKARVADEPHVLLEGRGSPYHQQSAFYPWIDLLQRAVGFGREDPPQARREKLERGLRQYRFPVEEVLPLFATLLGLPVEPAAAGTVAATPQRLRQQTLEALQGLVVQLATQQPVLMIVEDVHWADPSSLEVLELLMRQAQTARLLLVLTARLEFQVPWSGRIPLTWLTLTRLRRTQVERLVAAVSGGRALPREVLEQVARKTDGVPLFVEELTKMVLESALVREGAAGYELAGPLPPLAIPTTLQDSLMARLDRLSTTKVVVQYGATLGRSFSYALLQAVTGLDEAALILELGKLVEAELLYQRGLPPAATYSFKHALIQDAAYQTLLKSTRQQYHQRVGQVLEAQFPDIVQTHPELLAHHYTEAGLGVQAVPCWQRAGQRAIERSANLEAIAHLTRGLELLQALPESPERIQRELDLQTILAPALMATKGYAAPEVEAAYGRARELCRQVGETPRLIRVLLGLGTFYFIRGNLQAAQELGAQCLPLVQRQDVPRLRQAHLGLGTALFHLGEFPDAQAHLDQGIALSDPDQNRARPVPAVADPQVVCLCYAALTLWMLGYPDQALKRNQEALALARALEHPYSQTISSALTGWFHQLRRDEQAAERQSEITIALSSEHGFPLWKAQGTLVRGWARARQGHGPEAIEQVREGLSAWRATGAELSMANSLAMLADAYGSSGRPEDGLSLATEGLAMVEKTAERWIEGELNRIKGELLEMRPSPETVETEACFQRALATVRRQRAKSLELRVATSVSRRWQRQGKREAARQMLAEIYASFTEGFDTPDLQDARALLDTLR